MINRGLFLSAAGIFRVRIHALHFHASRSAGLWVESLRWQRYGKRENISLRARNECQTHIRIINAGTRIVGPQ